MSRPAPPPSRFKYDLIVDPDTLPIGVILTTRKSAATGNTIQNWIKNSGSIPFQFIRNDDLGRPIYGIKLVDDKSYGYYPNGVPMEGKTHLQGWVLHEYVEWHLLSFDGSLMAIYNGRRSGLPITTPLPPDEIVSFEWDFGGREWIIKGKIVYAINEYY